MATVFVAARASSGETGFVVLGIGDGRGTFGVLNTPVNDKAGTLSVSGPDGKSYTLQENGERRFSCDCEEFAECGDCLHCSAAEVFFG